MLSSLKSGWPSREAVGGQQPAAGHGAGCPYPVAGDGHQVTALRDLFAADAPDTAWLSALGADGGWSILSLDQMITRRPAERLALHRSGVTAYFLAPAWAKLPTTEKTARLLLWWPKLCQTAKLVGPGGLFELPVNAGSTLRPLRH